MAKTIKCECGAKMVWDEEEGVYFCDECGDVYYPECEEERGLRMMEEWAAYQYAGCTDGFWEDVDAGYIY